MEAVGPGEEKGPWDLSPASPVLSLPAIFWFSLQSSTKGLLSAVHTARWQSALTQLRKGCVEELITSACCCSYVDSDLTLLNSAAVFGLAVQSPVSLECGVPWRDRLGSKGKGRTGRHVSGVAVNRGLCERASPEEKKSGAAERKN